MPATTRAGQRAVELTSTGLAVMGAALVLVSPVLAVLVSMGAITLSVLNLQRGTGRSTWLVAAVVIAALSALASLLFLLVFMPVRITTWTDSGPSSSSAPPEVAAPTATALAACLIAAEEQFGFQIDGGLGADVSVDADSQGGWAVRATARGVDSSRTLACTAMPDTGAIGARAAWFSVSEG